MLIRLVFARSTSVDILAFSLSVGFLESAGMHIHFFMISKTFPFLQCAGPATGGVNGWPASTLEFMECHLWGEQ
jgi:hypothetical protein